MAPETVADCVQGDIDLEYVEPADDADFCTRNAGAVVVNEKFLAMSTQIVVLARILEWVPIPFSRGSS